jgi:hypothetical protein
MQLAHPLIYVLDITGYTALEEFLPVQLHTHPCLRNQNMFTRSTFWEMRPSNLVMRTVIEATMTKQINSDHRADIKVYLFFFKILLR